jgi:hypothetical protein
MGFKRHHTSNYLFLTLYSFFIIFYYFFINFLLKGERKSSW